jgi:hypothetical protein
VLRVVVWDPLDDPDQPGAGVADDNVPPTYIEPLEYNHIPDEGRKWDGAILKIKFRVPEPQELKGLEIAPIPASHNQEIFTAGFPSGSQMKISPGGRILRYALDWSNLDFKNPPPFNSTNPPARFSSNLEWFGGNSGGAVVNASTGQIVGIISQTMPIASDATRDLTDKEIEKEGNAALQNLNKFIYKAWVEYNKVNAPDRKFVPKGKTINQDDLREILDFWPVCKAGDVLPFGDRKKINIDYDFIYRNRLKEESPQVYNLNLACRADQYGLLIQPIEEVLNNKSYMIDRVQITVRVWTDKADKSDPIELWSVWGTASTDMIRTSTQLAANVNGQNYHFCQANYKLANGKIVETLNNDRMGRGGIPPQVIQAKLGPASWTLFQATSNADHIVKGRFLIAVHYSRPEYTLGDGTKFPRERITYRNTGDWKTINKTSPFKYEAELGYWRRQASRRDLHFHREESDFMAIFQIPPSS